MNALLRENTLELSFTMEKKKTVLPGETVSSALEYSPGINTFENPEGDILASVSGTLEFNEQAREVSVKGKAVEPLQRGAFVYGRVEMVKDPVVIISMLSAEKNGKKLVIDDSRGVLLVSRVSDRFVESLGNEFRIGDIVKAVITEKNSFTTELATNEPTLGVVKAFCITCRKPLVLNNDALTCLSCHAQETRHISSEYK